MVNINDIKYYGQWCRETDINYHYWWYSTYDEKIYNANELIEKFSFKNYEEIEVSTGYIPVWKTDLIETAKQFVIETKDKSVQRFFMEQEDSSFFREFDNYITSNQNYLTRWWYEFENAALIADAIAWCKENHIVYSKRNI